MTDRATERRLRAVEKKMGVTGNPMEHLSDLDLLTAIEIIGGHFASEGNEDAAAALVRQDAEEAKLRAFYERPDSAGRPPLDLEPDVRWPYLRYRTRWQDEASGPKDRCSATSEAELWAKLAPVLAVMESTR